MEVKLKVHLKYFSFLVLVFQYVVKVTATILVKDASFGFKHFSCLFVLATIGIVEYTLHSLSFSFLHLACSHLLCMERPFYICLGGTTECKCHRFWLLLTAVCLNGDTMHAMHLFYTHALCEEAWPRACLNVMTFTWEPACIVGI